MSLENRMVSVLQEWVMRLPLREQGALLVTTRGCDLAPKDPDCIDERYGCSTGEETAERRLVTFLRWCFMVPADSREVDVPGSFFRSSPPANWKPSQFGHYPLHWYAHVMHGFEVIGWRHPDEGVALVARDIYERMAHCLHLNPETFAQYEARTSEDRIAAGTVVS